MLTLLKSHTYCNLKLRIGFTGLSLGITCQNVYVPFYPQGSVVPSFYRHGKDKYASNSAYWIYKEAQVLVDRSWKDYGLQLYQARNATQQKLSQMRAEYDV
ncbi:hypothetical protein HMPREF0528_1731 [Lactobacillus johnsonii ATCC 33200]|uniref:Dipeptidase n=1 Tax=Lactobacillus johnsonii ATCC 33200 TaxID=525330 RepID=C2E7K7_LACJH|nr:hypothetical protein HMPREF0528_1731 [Lactobacillus johnsonii ATCC 33200]